MEGATQPTRCPFGNGNQEAAASNLPTERTPQLTTPTPLGSHDGPTLVR